MPATALRLAGALLLASVLSWSGGCKQKSADEAHLKTEQRVDYDPEEFGIGRRHTADAGCNRDIDALLDEVRLCYKNGGTPARCEHIQQKNSAKITRLKNSMRCAR